MNVDCTNSQYNTFNILPYLVFFFKHFLVNKTVDMIYHTIKLLFFSDFSPFPAKICNKAAAYQINLIIY